MEPEGGNDRPGANENEQRERGLNPSTSGGLQCTPKTYAPTMFSRLSACRKVLGLLVYPPG